VAEGAERIGLASLWANERFLRPTAPGRLGDRVVTLPPYLSINYDPIEALTFAAARTSRVRLGTSVLLSLLHRPVHLGRRLATLDALSGGRVIAGLGQPMMDQELATADVSSRRRRAGFREFVQALRAVWGPNPSTRDAWVATQPPQFIKTDRRCQIK
jgi:alkanesulfonate monooxygenase SsuD/methylene tetrahydromethanopterin reductase-like flavin-dependent oxidoreductase (luciferase family)